MAALELDHSVGNVPEKSVSTEQDKGKKQKFIVAIYFSLHKQIINGPW